MTALDADPFASPYTSTRIEYLFYLRRVTHRFLVRHAASLWARGQRVAGWHAMAPPDIAALPTQQRPGALAADEAARLDSPIAPPHRLAAPDPVSGGER